MHFVFAQGTYQATKENFVLLAKQNCNRNISPSKFTNVIKLMLKSTTYFRNLKARPTTANIAIWFSSSSI